MSSDDMSFTSPDPAAAADAVSPLPSLALAASAEVHGDDSRSHTSSHTGNDVSDGEFDGGVAAAWLDEADDDDVGALGRARSSTPDTPQGPAEVDGEDAPTADDEGIPFKLSADGVPGGETVAMLGASTSGSTGNDGHGAAPSFGAQSHITGGAAGTAHTHSLVPRVSGQGGDDDDVCAPVEMGNGDVGSDDERGDRRSAGGNASTSTPEESDCDVDDVSASDSVGAACDSGCGIVNDSCHRMDPGSSDESGCGDDVGSANGGGDAIGRSGRARTISEVVPPGCTGSTRVLYNVFEHPHLWAPDHQPTDAGALLSLADALPAVDTDSRSPSPSVIKRSLGAAGYVY